MLAIPIYIYIYMCVCVCVCVWLSLLFTVSDVSENVYRYVSSTVSVSIAIISLQISSPFFALGVTFIKAVHWTRSGADCKVKRRTVVVYITLGNKISLFFSGTRGKVSNPNRAFNAEFKYVSSFSPSSTVFFVTTKLSVKEMCMFTYYIHYSPNLKFEGCWFPSVRGIWNIPLHRPTIVRKHSCTALSVVPLFQGRNVLVETFPVFVADGTKIAREEIQVGVQECILRDILHPISWYDCNSSPTISR